MMEITRRTFVKDSVLASAGATLALGAVGRPRRDPPAAKEALAKGKIGGLEVSRLVLGGSPLQHYVHCRDLRYVASLMAHYNTPERVLETLALAEQQGINTLVCHPSGPAGNTVALLKRHREKHGGKMQWIIAPLDPIEPGLAKYGEQVQKLVDDGADAIYVWGVQTDALAGQGKIDLVGKAVDLIKAHAIPCGVAAHDLRVVAAVREERDPRRLLHQDPPSSQLSRRQTELRLDVVLQPRGDRRVHEGRREAVDRLQGDGRGGDPAPRRLPLRLRERGRFRPRRDVRLRDRRGRADCQRDPGQPSPTRPRVERIGRESRKGTRTRAYPTNHPLGGTRVHGGALCCRSTVRCNTLKTRPAALRFGTPPGIAAGQCRNRWFDGMFHKTDELMTRINAAGRRTDYTIRVCEGGQPAITILLPQQRGSEVADCLHGINHTRSLLYAKPIDNSNSAVSACCSAAPTSKRSRTQSNRWDTELISS